MRRFEAIQEIMRYVTNEIVVCNLGHPSQELFAINDRPKNFYMLGSMGLTSSIGLGLAITTDNKVIVIEGDGSLLMNLGTLTTTSVNQPENYILIIIDNEAYGSTGFQPSFTAKGISVEKIAKACNIHQTIVVTRETDIKEVMKRALKSNDGPYCIVIKTEKGMPNDIPIIPYDSITIRDRFMREIRHEDSNCM